MKSTIVWFRGHDLRLSDHAPLRFALSAGGPVLPLFVLDTAKLARARWSPHRTRFFIESLRALRGSIRSRGSDLMIARGPSAEVVPALADELSAPAVVAHRSVSPRGRARDEAIAARLGARFRLFDGQTLAPPEAVRTRDGRPHSVYSRFRAAFHEAVDVARPLPAPRALPPIPHGLSSRAVPIPDLESLALAPHPNVPRGGEREAKARLRRFVRGAASSYDVSRDRIDLDGTSRLSADLKFGTLSPRQVLGAVMDSLEGTAAARKFEDELLWREFAHSTLWDHPSVLDRPFREAFEGFPWRDDEDGFRAWAEGATGVPLVDAAARQLLEEGFVHNRARMVAASFLAKHLLVNFRWGERHYLRWLVDGDPANNDAGWQWCAGCGSDAQPYFRIFNPVSQGRKHDPEGAYVRRYVPELRALPDRFIHAPWEAPGEILSGAKIELGRTYPRPLVEHSVARARYLAVAKAHLRGGDGAQRR